MTKAFTTRASSCQGLSFRAREGRWRKTSYCSHVYTTQKSFFFNWNKSTALHRPGQTKTALPQAISWGLQCAEGVAYLHSQSRPIVHRDLKPRNALLFKDKTVVKICDFGTARDVPPSDEGGQSEQIMTRGIGTLHYIAPEVLSGRLYSKKCDVYSWAIVMWEITTCRTPYEEYGFRNLRELKMQGVTPSPPDGLPDTLLSLILSSWAFKSSDRPSMAKVVETMRDLNCFN